MNQTMNRNKMNQAQKDARLQLFVLVMAVLAVMVNLVGDNVLGILTGVFLIVISVKKLNLTI